MLHLFVISSCLLYTSYLISNNKYILNPIVILYIITFYMLDDVTTDTKAILLLALFYAHITQEESKRDTLKQTNEFSIIQAFILLLTIALNANHNLFVIFLLLESIV